MNAWSWFAIPPVLLAIAYMATTMLSANLTVRDAVTVTLPDLPVEAGQAKAQLVAEPDAEREIRYAAFGGQPPNRVTPKQKPAPVAPEFTLQSILVTDTDQIAVVNGNFVRQGDKVGGYRVFRIAPQAVWLEASQPSKDRFKVLHFPEYREVDAGPAANPVATLPAAPDKTPDLIELEKSYQQILEKLKL